MTSPRQIISQIAGYLQRLLTKPTEELSRVQRSMRYMYELASHCLKELWHDQALNLASGLTFRTIFSLIPMLVLALVVFRVTGGMDDMRSQIQNELYSYLGLDFTTGQAGGLLEEDPLDPLAMHENTAIDNSSIAPIAPVTPSAGTSTQDPATDPISNEITPDTAGADPAAPSVDAPPAADEPILENTSAAQKQETRDSLDKIIQNMTDKVANTSASGITIVGVLLLIWAAVALVVNVEMSLNQIYGTPTGRPWHLKIMLYWSIITLGPLLLAVSLYVAGLIMNWANTLGPIGWLVEQLSRFTALAASWLLLFLLYVLMPNTQVYLKPAAIGAFVAACLWELGKWAFKFYAANAGFSTIYGSLAMIPLFLYWVYITWAIVLFGAELSYTLQAMQGQELKHEASRKRELFIDPRWVLPLLTAMGRDFDAGTPSTNGELSQRLGLPFRVVCCLNQKLVELGIIHQVESKDETDVQFVLARTPDQLPVRELLALSDDLVSKRHTNGKGPVEWRYLNELEKVDRTAAGEHTLADLIRKPQPPVNLIPATATQPAADD